MRLLLFICLLFPAIAGADVPRCPGDQPPADALPLTGGALRVHRTLASGLRDRATMAIAPSVMGVCVTATASYVGVDWINPQTIGPPGTHLAFGLMAYAVGVQRFVLRPGRGNGATADMRGAWVAGCAYARVGLTSGQMNFLAAHLDAETGPRADSTPWLAMIAQGFSACGGN